ncbi:lysine--tRNA ligase [Paenibacillus ginsengarvi]|uniref:Lysine--tRNA ligase n=1 Tax=Paenibacillus ginsengarvi TaxID=400777 RepID=A0A3B0CHJ9_9BACL|nr:lysine--tRNA ligase [Paenibacillus ginsengarvi]RKN84560.1 lysine--tRNA ligase [Paenibacillus ginsengarvi]
MHWSEKIANQLIEAHPERDTFVCASGISPSGSVHIGNFREIVTTYFVTKALQKHGKKVRFLFSWDDFDRFRKVPAGVDRSFERYIGMPYSEVPCPFGCHRSYAEHYEKEFEHALHAFEIRPEYIYQTAEYRSRRYNKSILHAIKQRKEIYNILMSYKTGETSEEARNSFFPVHVYCESCRKDSTTVLAFDDRNDTLLYGCACGHQNTVAIADAVNIKLQWKIDWPMRWQMEDVLFEPGGRDHSSETGSYNVSKTIAEQIFGSKPPSYAPYEFIGIKGTHAKMSSSSGNNYTPDDLLQVYAPEQILFLFAKYQPSAAFNIGMDEDVLRNYTEYERYREAYGANTIPGEIREAFELSIVNDDRNEKVPKFSLVSSILPLVHFDIRLLRDVLLRSGENYSQEAIEQVANRSEYWIKQWFPQKLVAVNSERNIAFYETLSTEERVWVEAFRNLLRTDNEGDDEALMSEIYAICHDEDSKVKKRNQKRLFSIIYRLVLGKDEGPRIPLLIQVVGSAKMMALLDF